MAGAGSGFPIESKWEAGRTTGFPICLLTVAGSPWQP